MARVHLEHIKKVYPNGLEAVRDFCLDIADREFVVLVGPSGCGKSTTLRMIAGLEEITSGTISIADRVVNGVAPKDRDIAMVFQNYALYPHMTVYKNMAFALKLRRMPKQRIDEKVRRAARILGIEPLLARKPKQLSGGQRQRVAVGRAIVREPACFLFDEPLSNLDAKLRVEMRAELKRLHLQLQTTTVYVTHDQEEAMTLGDRVVVMKDGDIMQVGSPLDVYRHPRNIFVASFLGTPPMNLLQGKIVSDGRGLFFDEGSQRLPVPDWAAENLRPRAGSAVVLGIRPEAISEQALAHSHHSSLAVKVNVVEPLGERMDMYVSTEHQPRIVARIQAHRDVSAGETMNLHLDMQRAHFFAGEAAAEKGSGENLCLAAEKADRKLAAEAQL